MTHEDMINRLADIVPPAPPEWQTWVISIAIGLGVCAGVWSIYRYWRSRHHTHDRTTPSPADAQTKLAELAALWQTGALTDREAAYRLATVLRLGLGLSQLAPQIEHPAVTNRTSWTEALTLLQQLRYQHEAHHRLTPAIFDNAAAWLAAAHALEPARHV